MIKIVDNFLNQEYFKEVYNMFYHDKNFPWFPSKVLNYKDYRQFVHLFYNNYRPNSIYHELLEPLYAQLKVKALIKVKANHLWKTDEIIEHGFHTDGAEHINKDDNPDWKTAIFYINTNNGYTKFDLDQKIINSKANRLAIFSANVKHTGTTCTDKDERIVLNINYY
jgi:hypothetical protein